MRTIKKYTVFTSREEQSFKIPGWGGIAYITGGDFANAIEVYNHIDTDKEDYLARFLVTIPEGPSPKNDYVFAGGVNGPHEIVWFLWRNAVTEKVE